MAKYGESMDAYIWRGVLDIPNPATSLPDVTVTIVSEKKCPTCDGGDEFNNRPKVGEADGTWAWRCYNPDCPTKYYNPETGDFG